jgi:hypothetical protein
MYIKWVLIAIALAVAVWVVARPLGRAKREATGGRKRRTDTDTAGAPPGVAMMDDGGAAAPMAGHYRSAGSGSVSQGGQVVQHQPASTASASRAVVPSRGGTPPTVAQETVAQEAARGSGTASAESALGLWGDGYAQDVLDRWREVQIRFVDDPQFAAGEAERVVGEAVAALTASVNARKEELSTWRSGRGNDTEQLRAAVNRYREFLDRLLRV